MVYFPIWGNGLLVNIVYLFSTCLSSFLSIKSESDHARHQMARRVAKTLGPCVSLWRALAGPTSDVASARDTCHRGMDLYV